jgi:hypothetical protein
MADIFISYSSGHRDLTQSVAEALKKGGHSVWWDRELEAYATFREQIDAELSKARVVLVIWSDGAAQSDYVMAEAREALEKAGLVNALAPGFDPRGIPKPFGEYQAEKVEDVDAVMRAILSAAGPESGLQGSTPPASTSAPPAGRPCRRSRRRSPR